MNCFIHRIIGPTTTSISHHPQNFDWFFSVFAFLFIDLVHECKLRELQRFYIVKHALNLLSKKKCFYANWSWVTQILSLVHTLYVELSTYHLRVSHQWNPLGFSTWIECQRKNFTRKRRNQKQHFKSQWTNFSWCSAVNWILLNVSISVRLKINDINL